MARSGVYASKLSRKLRNIHKRVDNTIKPEMQKAAEAILADMKELVPVDSGDLQNALQARVAKNGIKARIGLITPKRQRDFYYARFIEQGTKGGKVKARGGGVLSDGSTVYGKEVEIPPMPARPFLQPAFDMNRDKAVEAVRAAVRETLDRVQKL